MFQSPNNLNRYTLSIAFAGIGLMLPVSSGCARRGIIYEGVKADGSGYVTGIDMAHGLFCPSPEEGSRGQLVGTPSLLPTQDHDAQLALIADPSHVVECNLTGATITGSTLRFLGRCGALRELNLSGTDTADSDIAELVRLDKLQTLHLSGTDVTDAGIKTLASLSALEIIALDNTAATANGIDYIATLPNIRVIYCRGIPLTPEYRDTLKKAKPNVKIITDVNSGQVL